MAILNVTNPTLADWAKTLDPNGSVSKITELLSQTNEILHDAVFQEGNLITGHKTTVRTSLPEVDWRELNKGIKPTKSSSAEMIESCGMLEARSEIDKELADLNGNSAMYRLTEDRAFLESMNIKQANTMFYGNPGNDPRQYLGLANRYNSLNGATADSVINGGGTNGRNHSIYLVVWGDDTTFCIFPKGSKAGLDHKDLGEQTVYMEDGSRMQAYCSLYHWKNGLVVKDWRYVVRICNIDSVDLAATAGTQGANAGTSIIRLMNEAVYRIPSMGMGRACFYMNRRVHSGLANMAMEKASNVLQVETGHNQFGSPHNWVSFQKIPMRRVDVLNTLEADVA